MGNLLRAVGALGCVAVGVACAGGGGSEQPTTVAKTSSALLDLKKGAWSPMGPFVVADGQSGGFKGVNIVGRLTRVAYNPKNPREAWIGAAYGGVFHNADVFSKGSEWVDDGMSVAPVGALVPDELTCTISGCATIWVGTGENSLRRDTYGGFGIAIGRQPASSPRRTWDFVGVSDFQGGSITALTLDPRTFDGPFKSLLVALSSGQVAAGTQSTVTTYPDSVLGIYKSDDRGASWRLVKRVPTKGPAARPTDLVRDPKKPKILYAAFAGQGIYRSTESGEDGTWELLNAGLGTTSVPGTTPLAVADTEWISLTAARLNDSSKPTPVYAALNKCRHPAEVGSVIGCVPQLYRLDDTGASWTPFGPAYSSPINITDPTIPLVSHGAYTHHLAVDPAFPASLLWSGVNPWITYNGGSTGGDWSPFTLDFHPDFHETVFNPAGIYAVSDGGFYTKSAGVFSDAHQSGLRAMEFQSLSARQYHGPLFGGPHAPVVFGGTQDNGALSFAGPEVWDHIDVKDQGATVIDADDTDILYDMSYDLEVTRTDDGGDPGGTFDTFDFLGTPKFSPAPPRYSNAFYAPMVQDPNPDPLATKGHHPLFAGTDRLYRSYDRGSTWSLVGCPIGGETGKGATDCSGETGKRDTDCSGASGDTTGCFADIERTNVITAIAIAPSESKRIYVGYYDGRVFVTKDGRGAATWSLAYKPPPPVTIPPTFAGVVTGIAIDPTDADKVYVTLANGVVSRVVGTITGGAPWKDLTGDLDLGDGHAPPINTVFVAPVAPYDVLVGTDAGVFFRPAGTDAAKWRQVGDNAVESPVYALAFDGTNLYAATHGRGVFMLGPPVIRPWFDACLDCLDRSPILPIAGSPPSGGTGFTDAPVFVYGLSRDKLCSMDLYQGATRCASGTEDALGWRLRTNARGQLVATLGGVTHDHAWACWNGRCAGDSGYSRCLSAPITRIDLHCADDKVSIPVEAPVDRPSPPPTILAVDVPADLATQGVLAVDVSLRDAAAGERLLCSVAASVTPGVDTGASVLASIRDAINAQCGFAGVSASIPPLRPGEDAPLVSPLIVRTTQSGTQLVTRVRAQAPNVAFGFNGASDGKRSVLTTPTLQVVVPTDGTGNVVGASGGRLSVAISTFEGRCSTGVDVLAGDSAPTIATRIALALAFPSADCPSISLPEVAFAELSNNSATLSLRGARSVWITSGDPSLTIALDARSKPALQIPPQTPPPTMQLFPSPLVTKTSVALASVKLPVGKGLHAYAHTPAGKSFALLGPEVAWSSSDMSVATIESGRIVAKSAGKAVVKATFGSTTTTIPIEVTP